MTANVTSVIITQPYYFYQEENYYNVIPAILTLNFDVLPSQTPGDYTAIADFGSVYIQTFNSFTLYNISINGVPNNATISFSGNTVSLTMNITYDTNCSVSVYYLSQKIPFTFLAQQDPTYDTPAIWTDFHTP